MGFVERLEKIARRQVPFVNALKIGGGYEPRKVESILNPIGFEGALKRLADLMGNIYTFDTSNKKIYILLGKEEAKTREEIEMGSRYSSAFFGMFGTGLIVASGTRITGNVTGSLIGNFSLSLSGIVLLLIALALFFGRKF